MRFYGFWRTMFCVWTLFFSCSTFAAALPDSLTVRYDSVGTVPRLIGEESLAPYLRDKEFAYDRVQAPETLSAWDKFILWLVEKVFGFLFREETHVFWRWALYIFSASVIVYVVLKLTKTDLRALFFGSRRPGSAEYTIADENIHELDFERLIAEAVTAGLYDRAVRLYYLQSLKYLSDRDLIDWRINKTNHDYLTEFGSRQAGTPLAASFERLTLLFEYICYGHFTLSPADFESVRQSFTEFNQAIVRIKMHV